MRTLRHEILSTSVVLAIPAALLVAFPFPALRFEAAQVTPPPAAVAFVTLTPDEELAVLQAAKAAWQSNSSAESRVGARLPLGELLEEPEGPLLVTEMTSALVRELPPTPYRLPAWCPSAGAELPARLEAEGVPAPEPAFSRAELLDLN